MLILVSACLMGIHCRYDGKCTDNMTFPDGVIPIPFCPEAYGGLATPRPPAEIRDGRVINNRGEDVTAQYQRGAEEAAALCLRLHIDTAVMQDKSPSCGEGAVHNGLFDGGLVPGDGMAVSCLKRSGVRVLRASFVRAHPSILFER